MKIVVSSTGKELKSIASPVFGRCPYFVVVEVEGSKIVSVKAIENIGVAQRGGAGISAAQLIANEKVSIVITIAVGPRAFDVLNQIGIEVYTGVQGTVEENVKAFLDEKLEKLSAPTGPMNVGMPPGKVTW